MRASPSTVRTGAALRNTESAETCGRVQRSTVLGAERLQPGTSNPAVAARVAQLARWLFDRTSNGDHHVLADTTGMGVTIAALFRCLMQTEEVEAAVLDDLRHKR